MIERAELVTPRLPVRALNFYPDICLLRSRRRGLETGSRLGLHGHEWGNPGYRQGHDLMDHRASPRPYQGPNGIRARSTSHATSSPRKPEEHWVIDAVRPIPRE